MKKPLSTCILTTAVALLGSGAALALDPWQTADLFQGVPGFRANATDIGTAADGTTLYSVGWADFNTAGDYSAIVRKSIDSGLTWATVDNYLEPGWSSASYRGFGAGTIATGGSLFACGTLWDQPTQSQRWLVRESGAGGTSWQTTDTYQAVPGASATCGDVKMNPYTGDVYAVGGGYTGAGTSTPYNWIVRKRAAGSTSFVTVDTVSSEPYAEARAVAFHRTAGVLVVGRVGYGTTSRWTVRGSANGGATWTNVDLFQDSAGAFSLARGIAVSPSGTIYVCGKAIQTFKKGPVKSVNNWVVRRSLDGGTAWSVVDRFGAESTGLMTGAGITLSPEGTVFVTGVSLVYGGSPGHLVRKGTTAQNGAMTWTTSDDFRLVAGRDSEGQGITSDAFGNIFSAGFGNDSTGIGHYLTRRLAGPQ